MERSISATQHPADTGLTIVGDIISEFLGCITWISWNTMTIQLDGGNLQVLNVQFGLFKHYSNGNPHHKEIQPGSTSAFQWWNGFFLHRAGPRWSQHRWNLDVDRLEEKGVVTALSRHETPGGNGESATFQGKIVYERIHTHTQVYIYTGIYIYSIYVYIYSIYIYTVCIYIYTAVYIYVYIEQAFFNKGFCGFLQIFQSNCLLHSPFLPGSPLPSRQAEFQIFERKMCRKHQNFA